MTGKHLIADARRDPGRPSREAEQYKTVELTRRGKPLAVLIGHSLFERLAAGQRGFCEAYADFLTLVDVSALAMKPDKIFEGVRYLIPRPNLQPCAMRTLPDLSTTLEPLRPKPASDVMHNLREHYGETGDPTPNWHELRYSNARIPPSQHRRVIKCFIASVALVSYSMFDHGREAADCHTFEHARLTVAGDTPLFAHGQIPAIPCVNDLFFVLSCMDNFTAFHRRQARSWI